MLAAAATSESALLQAFAVKDRQHEQVMHVACSSLDMIATVGVLTETAIQLLGEFTPGPLSLIVEKTALLPDRLVTMNGTVGIRVPDNAATMQIIAAVGLPLTATSLNRSGEPYVPIDEAGLRQLNWPEGSTVPVVEDPSAKRFDDASALVRVTGPEPRCCAPDRSTRPRSALPWPPPGTERCPGFSRRGLYGRVVRWLTAPRTMIEGMPMQVQINTGKYVDAKTDLMEAELIDGLSRYEDQLSHVDVHLSDQNAEKSGADDMRCTMEARLTGLKSVAVTHSAATVHDAYSGALQKLNKVLETSLAKVAARRGRDSIRHPDVPQLLPEDFPS